MLFVWAGLLFLIRKWPGDQTMSFSLHAARCRSSRLYYGVLFSTYLAMFYVFVIKWFVPNLHLSDAFLYVAVLAIILQFITAWVPQTVGWSAKVHLATAYGMSLLLLPMMAIIIANNYSSLITRVIGIAALLYTLLIWMLFISSRVVHRHYLIFQATYVASFMAVVLSATYMH